MADVTGAKYERIFEAAAPIERAWRALTEPREIEAWLAPEVYESDVRPGGKLRWRMTKHHLDAQFTKVEPPRLLDFVVHGDLCSFRLESIATGTRVHIVSGGLEKPWPELTESIRTGWDQCVADLILLLDWDVRLCRHNFRTWLGVWTRQRTIGLEVVKTSADDWGERVGLRANDVLLTIGHAALFSTADLWNVGRTHEKGELLEVAFLRDGKLQRATAAL